MIEFNRMLRLLNRKVQVTLETSIILNNYENQENNEPEPIKESNYRLLLNVDYENCCWIFIGIRHMNLYNLAAFIALFLFDVNDLFPEKFDFELLAILKCSEKLINYESSFNHNYNLRLSFYLLCLALP